MILVEALPTTDADLDFALPYATSLKALSTAELASVKKKNGVLLNGAELGNNSTAVCTAHSSSGLDPVEPTTLSMLNEGACAIYVSSNGSDSNDRVRALHKTDCSPPG